MRQGGDIPIIGARETDGQPLINMGMTILPTFDTVMTGDPNNRKKKKKKYRRTVKTWV